MEIKWPLSELLQASGIQASVPVTDVLIRQVTDDSRLVERDALFVAVQGTRADGHQFIQEAIRRGARALLLEKDETVPEGVMKILVPETRPLFGRLLHAFLGAPSKHLQLVGITGTNGKTTVSFLIQHLLEKAGIPCGLIGTVSYRVGSREVPSKNTTPGGAALQRMLFEMREEGLKACAIEVSSHALDQHRSEGLSFSCGVFTNLSPEHLDYHGTLQDYLQAKLRLFQGLSDEATAVLNQDDPAFDQIKRATRAKVLTYGLNGSSDLTAREIRSSLGGTTFRLVTPQGSFLISWRLFGRHNLENLLAAFGAALSLNVPARRLASSIESFSGVPGRLEPIEEGQPFDVFVDYAHTDGALWRVLTELRRVCDRKILVLFGCGGDRDRTKRPRMGRVAGELADRVIITSDNPRSEEPASIAAQIAVGLKGSSTPWEILLDRREAIQRALELVDHQWLVLIAGKGHETGQIVGDEVLPFDDRAVVRELLLKSLSKPVFLKSLSEPV